MSHAQSTLTTVMVPRPSIFEAHTLTLVFRAIVHGVCSAPLVESRLQFLFRCRSRNVGINSVCSALQSASLDDALFHHPTRAVGLAGSLQSLGKRVRKYGMAAGVLAERNRFADFEIALYSEKAMRIL